MAKLIGGEGAQVTLNSVSLSDHVTSATLTRSSEEIDVSSFGDTTRTFVGGMETGQLQITWQQDYASSEVDATIQAIVGTVVTFLLLPAAGAVGAANPSYAGSVFISDYTPISAEIGSLSTFSTSWSTSGAITRATS
jgi:hypothetical protein